MDNARAATAMHETPALTILYRYGQLTEEEQQHVIFASEYSVMRVDHLLSNRPEEFAAMSAGRNVTEVKPSSHPLLPAHYQFSPQSCITFEPCGKEVALYYRDCFAHKLGITRAEQYYLALVDGYLWGIVGFMLSNLMRRQKSTFGAAVNETFGFCTPSHYKRLNKLLMLCITSAMFRDRLIAGMPALAFVGSFGFQTTCLADVPELKTNRGILKLIERKKRKNGKYHLNYRTDWREETYTDCLNRWLTKDAITKEREWNGSPKLEKTSSLSGPNPMRSESRM